MCSGGVAFYFIYLLILCQPRLTLGGTSLEKENVTVHDDIFLALGHHLSLGLDLGFVTKLLQVFIVMDNSLDESLLKVTVNHTSSLRGLGVSTDSPLTDLISAGCEEALELEGFAHLDNELGEGGVGAGGLHLLPGSLLGIEAGKPLFVGHRNRDDRVSLGVLVAPGGNGGKMLVLLADKVALGQVDQVDNGLGSQKHERVDDLDLLFSLATILTLVVQENKKNEKSAKNQIKLCHMSLGVTREFRRAGFKFRP